MGIRENDCSRCTQSLFSECTFQSMILARWHACWYLCMSGRPMPPMSLGVVNLSKLSLGRVLPHIKVVQALRYVEKNLGGILIGIVCRRYKILGRMFILTIAALPNQEKCPEDHFVKSA